MLEIVVFLCGAVVMIVELVGSRILAPALGTSVVVWTSIIGVILAALSLGYWWGGRLADRNPSLRALSRIILAASAFTAVVGFSRFFLVEMIQAGASGLHAGSLAASLLLFAPSAVLLGMVAPFAARIRLTDPRTAGRTVGRLYALSTLGSIAGTFAGGYFLIAYVGSANILFLMAAVLAVSALLCHASQAWLKAGMALLFLGCQWASAADAKAMAAKGVHDVDTLYQRVLIYPSVDSASGRPMRALSTGPEGVQGAMYPADPTALALKYTRFFDLAGHFVPRMGRMLVLGGGAYSFPKYALARHPWLAVEVVEIDPGVTALAREHFALPESPRLSIVHQDARIFLNANHATYDVVIEDVFNSSASIPFHLATVEAVRRVARATAEDGVALVNVIAALDGPKSTLFKSLYATYASVFPQVVVIRVRDDPDDRVQNIVLAAFKTPEPPNWISSDPRIQAMLDRRVPPPEMRGSLVLTDDYAPVERFAAGW